MDRELVRLAAFTDDPDGGNPAGVHLASALPSEADMAAIAAEVGYSETAFLAPDPPDQRQVWRVRYFAPEAEVDFCGHATIAAGVLLAGRHGTGTFRLHTNVGAVPVATDVVDGRHTATLTSVAPRTADLDAQRLEQLLQLFGWSADALHPGYPPAVAFVGVWHPVIVLAERRTLAAMAYPFQRLRAMMAAEGWTTIQLLAPTSEGFACRNPFPVGGVVEDPATGAAAAAFGGYLRAGGLCTPPTDVTIIQGEDMGRRSVLHVHIPPGAAGIDVSGTAVPIST